MNPPTPADSPAPSHAPTGAPVIYNRLQLAAVAAVCILLFYLVSVQFRIPNQPGFAGSLLQQNSPVVAVVVTALAFLVSLVVATLFVARIHPDAGLYCACIGLATLSARAGAMRYVLFDAAGRGVYLMLALEMILLTAMLGGGWWILQRLPAGSVLRDPVYPAPPRDKAFTTIMHVLLMVALMALLGQTDSKVQMLAAVGLSSMLAAMGAHWFAPTGPSVWVWAGPLIVGLIGYVAGYFSPAGLEIGRTGGYFAALARPLPLDYASAGVAGALLGYWSSAKWLREKANADDAPTE